MTEPLDWARVPAQSLGDRKVRARLATWKRSNEQAGRYTRARKDGDDLLIEAYPDETVQARSGSSYAYGATVAALGGYPDLNAQIAAAFGWNNRPWRSASIQDALGVPAILRAVTMIANITGSLQLDAYRNGVKMAAEDRPRVLVRPDPFRTARDFFRDTAYNAATRGEWWWWVAKRDVDGQAMSLINVPPQQITVDPNPANLLRPIITWNLPNGQSKIMRNEDLLQGTLLQEPGQLRGYGPLQMCGAAVSVSVEAQEWAANFYAAGGYPNIWIKAAGELSGGLQGDPETDEQDDWMSEVQRLKSQWISTSPNTPKVTDEGIIDIKQFDPNPNGAQMLDARNYQNGDAARMFGIPGDLLEYAAGGSSLTYQNVPELMTNFLRTCLIPNYLEPIEQMMSDLLTRSTISRFNVDEVNRADVLTRYQVYQIGIEAGVLSVEQAQEAEGIIPGSVETAPVPVAPPAAIPESLPQSRTASTEVRCSGTHVRSRGGMRYLSTCNRLLSKTGTFIGTCPRCKKEYSEAA